MKKIKSGFLTRGFSLTKMTLAASTQAALGSVQGLFQNQDDRSANTKKILTNQIKKFTKEMGELKGSLMKVGQQLSVYGEYFFPPEVNQLLKSLQKDSEPIEWGEIEKIIKKRLTLERSLLLEIEKTPIGSASLGQVHRAQIKQSGTNVVLKVQYPGVAQAIDQDLRFIRSFISFGKFFSRGMTKEKWDALFKELKNILLQEVDYAKELELMNTYREHLANDPRFVIPKTYPDFSTKKILCTHYEQGFSIDSNEVFYLSQDRKNKISENFLDLFFLELFQFNLIQTDAHFGNYSIRISEKNDIDQIILFDFGATRSYPEEFLNAYRAFVMSACHKDFQGLRNAATTLGLAYEKNTDEFLSDFSKMCFLIAEPFMGERDTPFTDSEGRYHWGESDLPDRVKNHAKKIAASLQFRLPPKEMISIDRKLGGIFIFLKKMNAQINGRMILQKRLPLKNTALR